MVLFGYHKYKFDPEPGSFLLQSYFSKHLG